MDWDDPAFGERVGRDLVAAMSAPTPEPDADGWYRWNVAGREWKSRVFVDPTGMRQTPYAPGIYLDDHGDPHLNVPELCALVELEPTPVNMREVLSIVRVAVGAAGLTLRVTH